MGIFDKLFQKKTGYEILVQKLDSAGNFSIPNILDKDIDAIDNIEPLSNDQISTINKKLIIACENAYEKDGYHNWFVKLIKALPDHIMNQSIVRQLSQTLPYEKRSSLAKILDKQLAEIIYADNFKGQVTAYKQKHFEILKDLTEKLVDLPIIPLDKAKDFVRTRTHRTEAPTICKNHINYFSQRGQFTQFFSLDLLLLALGKFNDIYMPLNQIVQNAVVNLEPVPHIYSLTSYKFSDDFYGGDGHIIVRTGDEEYLYATIQATGY